MAKKFLIVIAAIVGIMAALAIIPAISNQGSGISLDYARESVVLEDAANATASRETLSIKDDGSAIYGKFDETGRQVDLRRFIVSGGEMKVLRELFLTTGFMQIPATEYGEKEGLANYTSYQLTVQSGEDSKSISWVNPEAASAPVPSIIVNAGTRLDEIIDRST
jgi:hypothetical protein